MEEFRDAFNGIRPHHSSESRHGLIQKAKTEDAKMELFNLDEDPRESNDVAGEHPEIVAKLWQIMQDSHTVPEGLLPQFTINLPAHP